MPSTLTRRHLLIGGSAILPLGCSTGESDIFAAAAAGDSKRVGALLDKSPELVNAVDAAGLRPLNHAARAGKASIVMTLSSRGADLNAGKPLLDACQVTDAAAALDMVTTLAGNNAEVNISDGDGRTPLHRAAERGHELVCWMLIHRGAKWDVPDGTGRTPLDVATRAAGALLRRPQCVEVVYSADRFRSDRRGRLTNIERRPAVPQEAVNRFVTASHANTSEAKSVLARHPDALNANATFDELAVEAAAHLGNLDWCAELVDLGSPYSICTAVALGDMAGVKRMLGERPDRLRERGSHDQGLLCYTAFGKPQIEIAQLLLSGGADVESRGLGQTTLHLAARRGHVELARFLLENGADVHTRSRSRIAPGTALELARKSWGTGRWKMIALLESYGAR